MINPEDPAYPTSFEHSGAFGPEKTTINGLNIRAYFAGLAMAAYASADYVGNSGTAHSDIAEWAVNQADALITALNKPQL